jgi:2',3'-cyclic-nucleotide 2'-phosphodiesterase (5'-nucleotidase family)
VDTGNSFASDRTTHGSIRVDALSKNEWVLNAYSEYAYDAMNLSVVELRSLSQWLNKTHFASRLDKQVILNRLVAANTKIESPDLVAPKPYIIREVTQANGKPLSVAFIGLTEIAEVSPVIAITDPIAAAKRFVPEARGKADVVIVLARLNATEARQLAREVTGINAIITGTGDSFIASFKVGETLVAFTAYETRFLGELRFYKDAQGKISVRDRFISVDPVVGEDPATLKFVADAKDASTAAYQDAQKFLNDFLSQAQRALMFARAKPDAGSTAQFVSSQTCAKCHADAYIKWSVSKHGRAMDSVVLKRDEFEAPTLQSHASLKVSDDALPKFASVQCEQCHGAGSLHAANPAKGYGRIADLKTVCSTCHTQTINPNFDAQAAWLKIKH